MKSVDPLESQLLKDVNKNLVPRSMNLDAFSSLTKVPAVRPAETIRSIDYSWAVSYTHLTLPTIYSV